MTITGITRDLGKQSGGSSTNPPPPNPKQLDHFWPDQVRPFSKADRRVAMVFQELIRESLTTSLREFFTELRIAMMHVAHRVKQ